MCRSFLVYCEAHPFPHFPIIRAEQNGPSEKFLGSGDLHDLKYDQLKLSSKLIDLRDFAIKGRDYTGLPIEDEFCPWTLYVYPSEVMKDQYVSSNATIFAVTAAAIFVATSIIFVVYDRWVERRQKVVMTTAARTHAIVSSLFPSNVRDRIFDLENDNKVQLSNSKESSNTSQPSTPVADLFADTTVCFMDIAGFTAWSSVREPCQVFVLLETLYGAFDAIAERRGVFKVETIGDSYVCVTGIPRPQKNHATSTLPLPAASLPVFA